MKRYLYLIFLSCLFLAQTNAINNEQEKLLSLLEFIGEDSITIDRILNSPEAVNPIKTMETYLMFNMRLEYDTAEKQLTWEYGWKDSIFVCKCAEFLTKEIICDTVLSLISPCLTESFLLNRNSCKEQILLECAELSVRKFYSRDAILIPELYYFNHRELAAREEKLWYYSMIKFILLDSPNSFYNSSTYFDRQLRKLKQIEDTTQPYYLKYRNLMNNLNDMDLARITIENKEQIIVMLKKGITNGEIKSQLVYSFMLLTGTFTPENMELGNYLFADCLNKLEL